MRVHLRLPALLFALTVLWVALWDDISIANVVGGLLVAIVVAWVTPNEPRAHRGAHFSPYHGVRYMVLLGWKLLESNLRLAWEILTPGIGTHTGIIAVKMESGSDDVVTLVANSITLTPGTLTVEVDRDGPEVTLYVHGMYTRDAESVRRDVLQLEAWALRGFGTVEVPQPLGESVDDRAPELLTQAEHLGELGGDALRVADRCQLDAPHPIGRAVEPGPRHFVREPRLSTPARSRDRQQALLTDLRPERNDFGAASDEARQRQ